MYGGFLLRIFSHEESCHTMEIWCNGDAWTYGIAACSARKARVLIHRVVKNNQSLAQCECWLFSPDLLARGNSTHHRDVMQWRRLRLWNTCMQSQESRGTHSQSRICLGKLGKIKQDLWVQDLAFHRITDIHLAVSHGVHEISYRAWYTIGLGQAWPYVQVTHKAAWNFIQVDQNCYVTRSCSNWVPISARLGLSFPHLTTWYGSCYGGTRSLHILVPSPKPGNRITSALNSYGGESVRNRWSWKDGVVHLMEFHLSSPVVAAVSRSTGGPWSTTVSHDTSRGSGWIGWMKVKVHDQEEKCIRELWSAQVRNKIQTTPANHQIYQNHPLINCQRS